MYTWTRCAVLLSIILIGACAAPSSLDGDDDDDLDDDEAVAQTEDALSASAFLLPLACRKRATISQGNNSGFSHTGVAAYAYDFALPSGTPLHAMRAGKVSFARGNVRPGDRCYSGGGADCANTLNYVVVDHGDNTSTAYLHLSSVSVGVGDRVARGARIGKSGGSGWSTGPHAHVQRQKSCGSWYCQSVRLKFADVRGGVPKAGDVVTSKNGC